MQENKRDKFKRLAELRGNRILKELQLLGNLSNQNNYEYTEDEIKNLFSIIEEEIRTVKFSFNKKKRREIKL